MTAYATFRTAQADVRTIWSPATAIGFTFDCHTNNTKLNHQHHGSNTEVNETGGLDINDNTQHWLEYHDDTVNKITTIESGTAKASANGNVASTATPSTSSTMWLGRHHTNSWDMIGAINDLILFSSPLSSGDRLTINNALAVI